MSVPYSSPAPGQGSDRLADHDPLRASDTAADVAADVAAQQRASDWEYDPHTPEQSTISLMVVYRGDIVHERYADGFDMTTRTRTWSTAKSIAATLIGMLDGRASMEITTKKILLDNR